MTSTTATTSTVQEERATRRKAYHEADVVIVGAGVFGCAAAFALASQDRSVILLERSLKEPNRIVGELLQPGGVESLRRLGLGQCLEGIDAVPCHGYNVIHYGNEVVIRYPPTPGLLEEGQEEEENRRKNKSLGDGNGRANGHASGHANGSAVKSRKANKNDGISKPKTSSPEGRSFHHGRFISKLRQACLAHPNVTVLETKAIGIIRGENSEAVLGVETRTLDPDTGKEKPDFFFGQLTLAADGYDSDFRKKYMPDRKPLVRSSFYALELQDCPLPHAYYGHVVIGAHAPVLLYQIGSRETRALIDVPKNCLAASPANGGVRGYMRNVVLPSLPKEIRPSFQAALNALNGLPRSMPNSWLPPTPQTAHPGLAILGDAMNMRHPLTGGGMTVALNDVGLLSSLLSPDQIPDLGDSRAVAAALSTLHWRRKRLTSIINVLAQALYSLFSGSDPNLAKLRRGCFEYFERGNVDAPVSMLGGLLQSPATLAYHFFSVAFLAIWLDACETGWWNLPVNMWNAVAVLWTACVVFVPVMWKEAL